MTKYTHYGLIFTAQDVLNAQTHRDDTPYKEAWAGFEALQATSPNNAIYDALRWRLLGETEAGARAIEALPADLERLTNAHPPASDIAHQRVGFIQAVECLRDHPAYSQSHHPALQQWVAAPPLDNTIARAWQNAINLAVGVALEDSALIDSTTADIRALIDTIHPAGYIASVVQMHPDTPQTFTDTVSTVHALTLAAEIAAHIGIDLWAHEKRTVSLMTAAFYPLYYYYYPEKWKWAEGLLMMDSQPAIQAAAGYLEIINRRRQNVRAVNLILNDIRPIFSVNGGAFTLTHHPAPPPQRRGWFR